tara:strand:+ start:73 stop:282 length:210 start_codon:yes stop_codon:yes gene_type:complete
MNKAITNALSKAKAEVIYDDHYLGVIRKFRADVELGGVDVRIALSKATTSGIGVAQIADLHRKVEELYP